MSPLRPLVSLVLLLASCGPAGTANEPPADVEVRGAPIDSGPAAEAGEPGSESARPTAAVPAGHDTALHGAAARVAAEGAEAPQEEGGATRISFTHLSFGDYDPVEAELTGAEGELPAEVLALDGRRVSILGFMQPMEFEEDSVRTFVLMRFPPGCCFGLIPAMDQWIDVEVVAEEGCDNVPARIVRVTGELDVGELRDDYGYLSSVYRLEADSVEVASE